MFIDRPSDESIADFLTFAGIFGERFESEVWEDGPAVFLPSALVDKYPRLLLVTRPDFDKARDTGHPRPAMDFGLILDDEARYSPPDEVRKFLKANARALENWFERCGRSLPRLMRPARRCASCWGSSSTAATANGSSGVPR